MPPLRLRDGGIFMLNNMILRACSQTMAIFWWKEFKFLLLNTRSKLDAGISSDES